METVIKELMPVLKEAIIAGKTVGLWWVAAAYILDFLSKVMAYVFFAYIGKGIYSLLSKAADKIDKLDK